MYNTTAKRKRSEPEINSGERLVEDAGYVTAEKRITNMMLAGQRLVDFRKEQFDFENEVDESFTDPTRSSNFDMADASQIVLSRESKIKQLETMKKASQNALDRSGEVLTKMSDPMGQIDKIDKKEVPNA